MTGRDPSGAAPGTAAPSAPFVLAGVLLTALLVRWWGTDFGLPYLTHPDEPGYVSIAQNIFKTGDLNPHFFNYPSLFFYLNTLAYIPYYLVGKLAGSFATPGDIPGPVVLIGGDGKTALASTFLLGRGLTVAFGCAAVALAFVLGRRLTSRSLVGVCAGAFAALLLAFSPTHVANSRYIAPDTFLVFFILLAFWAALQILERGRTRDYALAGLAIGLVASTKYNGALVVVVVVLAHFLRRGMRGILDRNLYLALAFSLLTFLATTPYALVDRTRFLADLQLEARHYATGHPGTEGNAALWYLEYLWQTEGPVLLLAVGGILYAALGRSKPALLLAAFPVIYFIFISTFEVRNDRTILPVLPFLFLLAAMLLFAAAERVSGLVERPRLRTGAIAATAMLALILVVIPLARTVRDTVILTTVNSLETARVWMEDNLPPGARVAVESYSPWVDPQRFSVQGFYKLIDNDSEWYVANGYEYLVFSERMFKRFYREPAKYPEHIALYEALFRACRETKIFTDGGYEVRVCHLGDR
jgi:4-amino-4-deoxy-L-arabinose transferase-like glycosyltransferase